MISFFSLFHAQADILVGPGATGSSFLKIPISARATGLAGAFTAVTGDVASLEYNPAGLAEIYRIDMNATLIRYLEDTKLQSFSIGYPLSFTKGAALGDGFLGPDSNKVFLGAQYRSFQGQDTTRDSAGIPSNDFDIKDELIQLGLAYAPFERLSLGLSGKLISSKLAGKSMNNYAFDGGFLWKLSAITTAGVSLLNVGPDKAFISVADPLPTTLRTGLACQTRMILFTADVFTGRDKITQEALGMELSPNKVLRVRGGILNGTTLDFAGGIGLMFSPSLEKTTPADRELKQNRKILDELNVPEENPVYQKMGTEKTNPLDFGIDYGVRTHKDLDVSHTVTLKILY